MRHVLILLGLLVGALWPADARAERRVALVVGNAAYQSVPKLSNPLTDAGAMAELLRAAGFAVVEAHNDLGSLQFKRVVREFASAVRGADIALVYYAGHGVEIGGVNYLIPTDARLASDLDAEDEAVSVDRIIRILEPAKRLRLVILDACRDNPFLGGMRRAIATRAVSRGLAKVEPATSDTLIAFAAKAGSTAEDGADRHSPFTAALLKHVTVPGLDVRIAFGRVRDEVLETTGGRQEPFVYGSLGGATVALVSEPKAETAVAPPPEVNPRADARRDYELAERVGTLAAWDSFLAVHKTGFHADLARAARAKLASVAPAQREIQPSPPAAREPAPPAGEKTALAAPTTPAAEDAAAAEQDLSRRLQAELDRVGCDPGAVDGEWGGKSRTALQMFNRHAATRFDTEQATNEALDAVRGKTGRVCPLVCGRGMKAEGDRCIALREIPSRREPEGKRERESKREPPAKREPVAKREPPSRRDSVRRREQASEERASRARTAKPAAGAGFISPLCGSYFNQDGRRCCTADRGGGAPRIICQ